MFSTGKNTRIINLDSIVILSIVFFGLLICSKSSHNSIETDRKPVTNFISISDNTAFEGPSVRIQIFKNTISLNKHTSHILTFKPNILCENRITGYKVTRLQVLRLSSINIPHFLLRYHIFPSENDEPPILS
jgi:hypothetical protein